MTEDTKLIISNGSIMQQSLISMASESWRFSRVFDRLVMKLDAGEKLSLIHI